MINIDYEKKYKKALRRAEMILCNLPENSSSIQDIETIFPELAESKDEQIRKEIVKFLKEGTPYYSPNSITRQKWATWLEKQKEQKPAEPSEDERIVNFIKNIIMGAKRGSTLKIGAKDANDCIAYLEKQKLISDSLKAAGIDVRQDGSIERHTIPYLEKQKEQKDYNKLYEDIVKSEWFKEAYEGKSLGCDYEPAELKPVEWSDEDEKALKRAINICKNDFGEDSETAKFLKSLPERFHLLRKR